jgi:transcription antitermination protein NusB
MSRKRSREVAMELLFQMSINKDNVTEAIENFNDNTDYDISEIDMNYVERILSGVHNNQEQIDGAIESNLINWKLSRISKINLAILRLCTYELLFEKEIPDKVSINEALELAKKYSEEKSVPFLNGVLDKMMKNSEGQ